MKVAFQAALIYTVLARSVARREISRPPEYMQSDLRCASRDIPFLILQAPHCSIIPSHELARPAVWISSIFFQHKMCLVSTFNVEDQKSYSVHNHQDGVFHKRGLSPEKKRQKRDMKGIAVLPTCLVTPPYLKSKQQQRLGFWNDFITSQKHSPFNLRSDCALRQTFWKRRSSLAPAPDHIP